MKKFVIYLSLLVICLIPLANVYASDAGVEVAIGNPPETECAGFDNWIKFDPPPDESASQSKAGNTITVTSTAWKEDGPVKFNWTATIGVGRVVVKASSGANEYGDWDPGHTSGSAVSVKKDPSGGDDPSNFYAISHITFCWNDPQYVTASATVGSCSDPGATTSEPVTLSVMGATMNVTGPGGYSHSLTNGGETINGLTPGTYSITYSDFQSGYTDPGNLPTGFVIEACTIGQAEASAEVLACREGDVTEPVVLSVTNAKMHVTGNGKDEWLHNESKTFYDWPIGTYSLSYEPDLGYTAPEGPFSFTIGVCESKEDAFAEADPQACKTGDVTTPVFLSVIGATMNVSGPGGYTTSLHNEAKTIEGLESGTYTITYVLDPGYQDPGNLPASFFVGICEVDYAEATAVVEACGIDDDTEPVSLSVNHATMHVAGPGGYMYNLTNGAITLYGLEEGDYTITYTMEAGYEDPGNLPDGFTIFPCEKGDEFVDLTLSVKCVYGDTVTHKWVVTNMNTFAVDFTWSTAASEGSYAESGSATVPALGVYEFHTKYVAQDMGIEFSDAKATKNVVLADGICEKDEEPDVPAGGLGPSVISLLAPAMIGVSGTSLTWIMLKRKTKKSK